MTLTCTIIKNGRHDEYGRPLAVGDSYTGSFDFVQSLYCQGFCDVKNPLIFDDDSAPAGSYFAPIPVGTEPVSSVVNPVTMEVGILSGSTVAFTNLGAALHYRLATFGDSRSNVSYTQSGAIASGVGVYMDRVASNLVRIRPDMKIVFNGGVSGDTVANWSATRGSSQSVSDLLAAQPDAVIIQYGINDILGWNGSSPSKSNITNQITNNLKAACAAFMGAGVFVILESINTCAPAAVSFINGYSSAGGFGTNVSDRLDILKSVNTAMKTWLSSWPERAVYVDTAPAFSGSDGYAKTDGSYLDGTHGSAFGSLNAALLVDSAIRYKLPLRPSIVLPGTGKNAVRGFWTNPTAGLGENIAITADSGTWAAETYSIDGPDQTINFNCTGLSSGYARRIVDLTPLIIGAGSEVAATAGDVFQGRVQYSIDDGARGKPNVFGVSLRPRIYYNDASNEFVHFGQPSITTSTNFPRMPAHAGQLLSPGLAIKSAMSSTNITSATRFQIMLYANTTGPTRIKLRSAEWRKVA